MRILECRVSHCRRPFLVDDSVIDRGFACGGSEWRFLAVCPSCGVVYDYTIQRPAERDAARAR